MPNYNGKNNIQYMHLQRSWIINMHILIIYSNFSRCITAKNESINSACLCVTTCVWARGEYCLRSGFGRGAILTRDTGWPPVQCPGTRPLPLAPLPLPRPDGPLTPDPNCWPALTQGLQSRWGKKKEKKSRWKHHETTGENICLWVMLSTDCFWFFFILF